MEQGSYRNQTHRSRAAIYRTADVPITVLTKRLGTTKARGHLGDSLFWQDRIQDWRRERQVGSTQIVQGGDKTSHWNASEVLSVAE
jgi:hypothetical protein